MKIAQLLKSSTDPTRHILAEFDLKIDRFCLSMGSWRSVGKDKSRSPGCVVIEGYDGTSDK